MSYIIWCLKQIIHLCAYITHNIYSSIDEKVLDRISSYGLKVGELLGFDGFEEGNAFGDDVLEISVVLRVVRGGVRRSIGFLSHDLPRW